MRITYYTNENTQECLVTMEKDGEVKTSIPQNQKEYQTYKTLHEKINSSDYHLKIFLEDLEREDT